MTVPYLQKKLSNDPIFHEVFGRFLAEIWPKIFSKIRLQEFIVMHLCAKNQKLNDTIARKAGNEQTH